jgi:hypothetical protein
MEWGIRGRGCRGCLRTGNGSIAEGAPGGARDQRSRATQHFPQVAGCQSLGNTSAGTASALIDAPPIAVLLKQATILSECHVCVLLLDIPASAGFAADVGGQKDHKSISLGACAALRISSNTWKWEKPGGLLSGLTAVDLCGGEGP